MKWNYVAAFAAVALLAGSAAAENGRDFAGEYELSNVIDGGDTIALTFTVRVFNYSGTDVASATVVLGDPLMSGQSYCSFPNVAVAYHANIWLRCSATVPHSQYDLWTHSGPPVMHVDTTDANGNTITRPVELTQGPVGEAN